MGEVGAIHWDGITKQKCEWSEEKRWGQSPREYKHLKGWKEKIEKKSSEVGGEPAGHDVTSAKEEEIWGKSVANGQWHRDGIHIKV